MRIRFLGPIKIIQQDEDGENEEQVTSPDLLKKLDARVHSSEVADYLFDGPGYESLEKLEISGGIFGLSYIDDQIYMHIDYFSRKQPDDNQVRTLWQFTEAQIYDGAGPIFSADCEDETGLCPLLEPAKVKVIIDENT